MNDEEKWFGVFQGYRPNGDGVESLFVGLPDSDEYVHRLRTVYKAAHHDNWAEDAYFVVRSPREIATEEVIGFGRELLSGLRLMALLAKLGGNGDLLSYLDPVSEVIEVPNATLDRKNHQNLDTLSSANRILIGLSDYDHAIPKLREGYYSVACDYWLGWYLQWPYFRASIPRDVFRPYFDLWSCGYAIAFNGESLQLAKSV